MKKLLIISMLLVCAKTIGQVGIGTTNPQETLDVNGTTQFRVTNQSGVATIKLGGLDENGVFREIYIGTNLMLNNNTLSASSNPKFSFGAIDLGRGDDEFDDVDLRIGAGEENEDKTIIRIYAGNDDVKFTGIKAGEDGQHIWLYPQDGKLELKDDDDDSAESNQIESNSSLKPEKYEMIHLVYDGERSKWIVMDHKQ
ncbi:hypothetical protein KO494_15475 [Lacinutrix sp. C3R15]|uniref:hypothetical protein n=1 Tax=Flavobacteriaceae TaxID=49546 RepID=UPI001C09CF68|nr:MULTISPECIES: hypothetical protein [Flavobacteriaceae]MBU2940950.1 hypothetical protein [Lacinutrix sp. C3R15]MDO6624269.1 hypothetical protein [Oceanihabitans sp. 1_MG-2023]